MKTSQGPEIGERLKFFRKARGFSIRVLAEKAGISPNTISLIESNATSPTVATLQTIANVLDIPLASFFMEPEQDDEVTLIPAGDQEKAAASGLIISVFPRHILDHRVQIMRFAIQPGVSSGKEPLIHSGDELVMCIEGELEYTVKDHVYRLKKQDGLAFRSGLPHSWINRSRGEARVIVMITTEADQTLRAHIQLGG